MLDICRTVVNNMPVRAYAFNRFPQAINESDIFI